MIPELAESNQFKPSDVDEDLMDNLVDLCEGGGGEGEQLVQSGECFRCEEEKRVFVRGLGMV